METKTNEKIGMSVGGQIERQGRATNSRSINKNGTCDDTSP